MPSVLEEFITRSFSLPQSSESWEERRVKHSPNKAPQAGTVSAARSNIVVVMETDHTPFGEGGAVSAAKVAGSGYQSWRGSLVLSSLFEAGRRLSDDWV